MSETRPGLAAEWNHSRATPLGTSKVVGLVGLGVLAQLVALITLPPADLYVAIPVTVLITVTIFIAEFIPPRGPLGQTLTIALYAATIALAATTGPALAGLITLVATGPLLLLAVRSWSAAHRLLTDISASMVTAVGFWAVEQSTGRAGEGPDWVTITVRSALALTIVLAIRRIPGAAYRDHTLTRRDALLVVAPITVIAVTIGTILPERHVAFTAVCLLSVLICLSVMARILNRGRANAGRAVEGLVAALDHRHPDTSAHSARVFALVSRMLDGVPELAPFEREAILTASLIHDIGKVATPDQALLKSGALTSDEREVMQRHATIGEAILRQMDGLEASAPIVRHHHERWDGAGYPDGLVGPGIPLGARLIAVADTYDAMTHDRVYRRALGHSEALAELRAERGRQFDPIVVDIFSRVIASERRANAGSSPFRQVAS